jgi:hypothetical protein
MAARERAIGNDQRGPMTPAFGGQPERGGEQHMKRLWLVTLRLLILWLGASVPALAQREPDWDRSYQPPTLKQYKVDAKTLYGVGISERFFNAAGEVLQIGTVAAGPSFPNKCFLEAGGREITLSDPFVRHYAKRGFTVEAICLAVTAGGWVKYNVETGKPLRTANSYLIDIPDCFKNGVPFLECTYNFEHQFGLKATDTRRKWIRDRAMAADRDIRALIAGGKFSQTCTCDDFEIVKSKIFQQGRQEQVADVRLKSGGSKKVSPEKLFSCRADAVPDCARGWLAGRDLSGWRVFELQGGVYFQGTLLKGFTDYGPFDIAKAHPRGYAYRIGSPEGDDDRPSVELPSGSELGLDD